VRIGPAAIHRLSGVRRRPSRRGPGQEPDHRAHRQHVHHHDREVDAGLSRRGAGVADRLAALDHQGQHEEPGRHQGELGHVLADADRMRRQVSHVVLAECGGHNGAEGLSYS
jgi:hypothetical protein